jgi:hypothetical protein
VVGVVVELEEVFGSIDMICRVESELFLGLCCRVKCLRAEEEKDTGGTGLMTASFYLGFERRFSCFLGKGDRV